MNSPVDLMKAYEDSLTWRDVFSGQVDHDEFENVSTVELRAEVDRKVEACVEACSRLIEALDFPDFYAHGHERRALPYVLGNINQALLHLEGYEGS